MSKTITVSDETWNKIKDQVEEDNGNIKEKKEKKFEIKNRWTGDVIYTSSKITYKDVVEEAVSSEADLHEADLREADLRGADLRGADLHEADLRGADLMYVKFGGKGTSTKIKKSQLDDFLKALGVTVED